MSCSQLKNQLDGLNALARVDNGYSSDPYFIKTLSTARTAYQKGACGNNVTSVTKAKKAPKVSVLPSTLDKPATQSANFTVTNASDQTKMKLIWGGVIAALVILLFVWRR